MFSSFIKNISILKKLKVDGVGMGVEAAEELYRKTNLNRHADQDRIVRAFDLLRDAGIRTTAYNVIGFPHQNEQSIIKTIKLNIRLNPDNITVAFYSPFIGTNLQRSSAKEGLFDDYVYDTGPSQRGVASVYYHVCTGSRRSNLGRRRIRRQVGSWART